MSRSIKSDAPNRWKSAQAALVRMFSQLGWQYVAIVLWALLAHGLLLLNDGVYWDGWLYYTNVIEKDWSNLYGAYKDAGAPFYAYVHWWIGYLPNVNLGYRLVGFAAIALFAILVYTICNESELLTRAESMWIVLLSVAHPVFQILVTQVTVPYIAISLVCYFLAVLLAIKAEKVGKVPHILLRVCALVFFVVGLITKILIPFHFGFLLFLLLYVQRLHGLGVKQTLAQFLPRRLDYVLLPFLVWFVLGYFLPQQGGYAGEYAFKSPLSILYACLLNLSVAVYGQLNAALKQVITLPLLGLLAVWAVLLIASFVQSGSNEVSRQKANPLALLAFGSVLLGLGILPFAATGRVAAMRGWEIRHALLIPLPLAIILLGGIRLLAADGKSLLSKSGLILLTSIGLGFTIITITDYISWQARWIKDRSIMVNLAKAGQARAFSVYWVNDQYPLGGEDNYRFYEWAAMFKQVWGDEARIGLDQRYNSPDFLKTNTALFTKSYSLSDFDPAGCQATLTIQRGPRTHDETALVSWYYYYKFIAPGKIERFLEMITKVQVQPVESPLAVNCKLP